jgi:hypothetical protein
VRTEEPHVNATATMKTPRDFGLRRRNPGTLPAVRTVHRALDLEGMRTIQKSTDGVGSRHHSAYRLCNALPGAVAVVASQEGNTRFVRRTDGGVAY